MYNHHELIFSATIDMIKKTQNNFSVISGLIMPFIVAEIGASHNGSLDRAIALVEAAAKAGASAVKFQTFKPESMVADESYVIEDGPWKGRKLIDLYREAYTPWEWHPVLFQRARELDLIPFSSPFDSEAVDFLETLNCPIYKIASFEIGDLGLIRKAASTGKGIILSTGMATELEIMYAVQMARHADCKDLTLLKCTSAYPASYSDANLATMTDMKYRFGCRVGISDHTFGHFVSVAAVALGATVIEKHLTISRNDGGPDSKFSMEPHEFAQLVMECNRAAKTIGQIQYGPIKSEIPSLKLRRSLYFADNLPAGTVIERHHIRTARPALGLEPRHLDKIIGQRLTEDVYRGNPVRIEVIDVKSDDLK